MGDPIEVLEMLKWNIPTVRAPRLNEKNGVTCLFIMFTPRFALIKMSKMAHFLYFLLMTSNFSNSLDKIFKWIASERSYLALLEKCYGLLGSLLSLARCQPIKVQDFSVFVDLAVFF